MVLQTGGIPTKKIVSIVRPVSATSYAKCMNIDSVHTSQAFAHSHIFCPKHKSTPSLMHTSASHVLARYYQCLCALRVLC